MRYSREHKQETHDRIVRKASVRLREKGAHGVGVADLMKEAGLTHGGFYAHFDSREALVMQILVAAAAAERAVNIDEFVFHHSDTKVPARASGAPDEAAAGAAPA